MATSKPKTAKKSAGKKASAKPKTANAKAKTAKSVAAKTTKKTPTKADKSEVEVEKTVIVSKVEKSHPVKEFFARKGDNKENILIVTSLKEANVEHKVFNIVINNSGMNLTTQSSSGNAFNKPCLNSKISETSFRNDKNKNSSKYIKNKHN